MVRSLDNVADYSATPKGYLAAAGRIHFSTWSGALLQGSGRQFLSGLRRHRAHGLRAVRRLRRARRPTARSDAPRVAMLRRDRGRRLGAVARHARRPSTAGCSTCSRRCTACAPRPASATCSCSGWPCSRDSALARARAPAGAAGGRAAGRARQRRSAARAVRLPPFDGIPAIYALLRRRAWPRGRSPSSRSIPRRAVFENGEYVLALDRALAAADERLQRLHARLLPHYADAFWYFPQDWAIQAMKDAGVTHVVVHPAGSARDHQDVAAVLDKRSRLRADGDRRRRHPAVPAEAVDGRSP